MSKLVVILNGPIGVGKSTIGAAVAARLSGACIESDDLGNPDRAWHEQVDVVNEELISISLAALMEASLGVAALPLESARWDDIRVKLAEAGVEAKCATLAASCDAITHASRNRAFTDWEHERLRQMLAEGYDARPFGDAVVRTDTHAFAAKVDQVAAHIAGWMRPS